MSAESVSQLLDLPPAWLALLLQHVACGPGGLATAAALSQTCKFLQNLSEGAAVTYRNLTLTIAISSPDHPFWQWLAKRRSRIAGLSLDLRVEDLDDDAALIAIQVSNWMQRLQTLSGIPGVQLRLEWVNVVDDLDHSCIAQWLRQYGQLISHLSVEVFVSEDRLKLGEFSEAAASCRSIELTFQHFWDEAVDFSDLAAVAGSLQRVTCEPIEHYPDSILKGTSALSSMSQLTALHLVREDFGSEEPWGLLANLTGLQQLSLEVNASGDPSPLSALTGLSYLYIKSFQLEADSAPFSFSSLQPLSTLQQLEELHLDEHACAATSLQGLAGLINLKVLGLGFADSGGRLKSLAGISAGVIKLLTSYAPDLVSLAGIECCTNMEELSLSHCGVSSLQPLKGLTSMKDMQVYSARVTSLEGLNSMSLQSLSLRYCHSLTQLSAVAHLSGLESLVVEQCGVTSLQPLSQLGEGLKNLKVIGCSDVCEQVLELPHVRPTAGVVVKGSNVRKVVLAGALRDGVCMIPC
jgi:Leucine-rich repeat (LRR) protein